MCQICAQRVDVQRVSLASNRLLGTFERSLDAARIHQLRLDAAQRGGVATG
jgi:hypothetical protein